MTSFRVTFLHHRIHFSVNDKYTFSGRTLMFKDIFLQCKNRAKYMLEQENYKICTKYFMDQGIKGSRNAI